ncbi:sensor histidine kinase [Chitinophaga filiformis]|uniref:Histidine kinase n=1 Tax=Chitinophaga filiformis TaxID=104663 RepID=A0A1G7Y5G9_CHIFI|nr:histidine kinase [Chitinophaga filiformis]SDG91603.1 Histidine kinase [Chitinophaga filiformis]
MTKRFYIAGNRLLTHILFWISYLLVYTSVHADGEGSLFNYFLIELQRLPAAMLVPYINIYVLFPRLFKQKRYIAYATSAIALLFVASLLDRILVERFIEPTFFPDTTYYEAIFVWYLIFKVMLWFLAPVLLFTLLVKMLEHWFDQERIHQDTLHEKLEAELNYLKAQVHPHFLFNTLNNLYALTLQSSTDAPKVVLKLSGLMSYMLYDSQSEDISLDKEIAHISNYIELEKLRYGNRLDVSLNVSGEIEGKKIAPLLLIPFVENAFKHGVSHETDNVWVTIDLKVKDEWLSVKVENSHTGTDSSQADNVTHGGGIGLLNVKRRLDLLYPETHKLILQKEPEHYTVDLKIKLQ